MPWQMLARTARRLVIGVVGLTVVLLGLVLLFTPGPAMVVIPAGLAILSLEFVWARRLLRRVRQEIDSRLPERFRFGSPTTDGPCSPEEPPVRQPPEPAGRHC